jgi:hypothetical protein
MVEALNCTIASNETDLGCKYIDCSNSVPKELNSICYPESFTQYECKNLIEENELNNSIRSALKSLQCEERGHITILSKCGLIVVEKVKEGEFEEPYYQIIVSKDYGVAYLQNGDIHG